MYLYLFWYTDNQWLIGFYYCEKWICLMLFLHDSFSSALHPCHRNSLSTLWRIPPPNLSHSLSPSPFLVRVNCVEDKCNFPSAFLINSTMTALYVKALQSNSFYILYIRMIVISRIKYEFFQNLFCINMN